MGYNDRTIPNVITLCGSTKFKDHFRYANLYYTLGDNVVMSCAWFGHTDKDTWYPSEEEKILLDKVHRSKIDLSDEIVVIDVYGYIGESTLSEIKYAKDQGKKITYLSSDAHLLNYLGDKVGFEEGPW
ncbi:MAG: hypothetical protein GY938_13090 [Ketobacter sp.]|nr:hypothetical protein [Ketobacter sp.]